MNSRKDLMKKAAFIYSENFEKYRYPPEHPFNVSRAGETYKILTSMHLLDNDETIVVEAKPAETATLKKFHTSEYLSILKKAAEGKCLSEALSFGIGTGDCPVFKDMYDYSALACGATIAAAELITKNKAKYAFNPSGGFHHAGSAHASGFCYLNDIAIGCLLLAERNKKVFYLDVDVHHGNGVCSFFYDRSDVMTVSFHETGRMLYPGTGFEDEIGEGAGEGYCINVPLPINTYDEAYFNAFREIVPPLLESYQPDVIVFELGVDGLAGDPLAHLSLTNNLYADIIHLLLNYNLPILMTGGGGYNLKNTVRAWALAFSILAGEDTDMYPGVSGVMLENTEWQGGLQDRKLTVSRHQKKTVKPVLETTIKRVKQNVFPIHQLC